MRSFMLNEKKCQVVAVSLQQRELPPHQVICGLAWRFLLPFPWAEGSAQPGPSRHQSCCGLWYWWEPGIIPALLQGPSAAPGLWALPFPLTSMLLSFMKEPEEPTATGMGGWGGAEWSEQTNRVWDLHGGIQEPEG